MKITILGAGKSGVAAAILANNQGETVFVSDSSASEKIKPFLDELASNKIDFESGTHSEKIYDCDLMILSPGIKKELYVVQQFYHKQIPVISEIEYAYRNCTQPIIAITGSNGKTTTTTLLGRMLEREFGGHRTAGNIGKPLTEEISLGDDKPLAVELSSFQLETIDTFKPKTAVLLNISENHLDWYRTMTDYISAKLNIIKNADADTELIINADDDILNQHFSTFIGKKYTFSLRKQVANAFIKKEKICLDLHGRQIEIIDLKDLTMKGPHHIMNMMAASIAAYLNGVSNESIHFVLKHFDGLDHRMEIIQSSNGRIYINDSKATSVEALKMALQSFDDPVYLIAGGKDKGGSYSEIADLISRRTKVVFIYGEAAPKMETAWKKLSTIVQTNTMLEAVNRASAVADIGDVILLSPACSSYDQFSNYEERGNLFKDFIKENY